MDLLEKHKSWGKTDTVYSFNTIFSHPHLCWYANLFVLHQYPNICDLIDKYPDNNWNWQDLSYNSRVFQPFVERYIDKPWNWRILTENNNITLDFIERHIDKNWSWVYLSKRHCHIMITWEFVQKHLDKLWDWEELSSKPGFADKIVENRLLKATFVPEKV